MTSEVEHDILVGPDGAWSHGAALGGAAGQPALDSEALAAAEAAAAAARAALASAQVWHSTNSPAEVCSVTQLALAHQLLLCLAYVAGVELILCDGATCLCLADTIDHAVLWCACAVVCRAVHVLCAGSY